MKAPKKALKKLFPPGQSRYDSAEKTKEALKQASEKHSAALIRLAKR